MSDEAISTVQEDIAKDLYEMAAYHKEEASRIMQEFDKHDVKTSIHLHNLAAEQRHQTPGLGAPKTDKTRPSTEEEDNDGEDEDNEDDDEENDNEADNEGSNHDQQHEPSLFDMSSTTTCLQTNKSEGVPWVRQAKPWPTATRTCGKVSKLERKKVGVGSMSRIDESTESELKFNPKKNIAS